MTHILLVNKPEGLTAQLNGFYCRASAAAESEMSGKILSEIQGKISLNKHIRMRQTLFYLNVFLILWATHLAIIPPYQKLAVIVWNNILMVIAFIDITVVPIVMMNALK